VRLSAGAQQRRNLVESSNAHRHAGDPQKFAAIDRVIHRSPPCSLPGWRWLSFLIGVSGAIKPHGIYLFANLAIARSLRCVVENGRGFNLFQRIEKKVQQPTSAELPDQKRYSPGAAAILSVAGIICRISSYPYSRMQNERSQSGTFEELAMPLFASLYNFAHWLTQNRAEAEDLVQETYMKALKGFQSFQQGTNFRAWMFRILRNTFLTSRTGLKASTPLEEEEDALPPVLETPESALLARVDHELLQSALEQLAVHYREVVLLCDVEEMSYQEIAETLGIPIGTVMSRISRARKALRDLLGTKVRGASQ
jgi:RNA polymerase sigma-70 factor (ECF subfamily)